MAVWSMTCSLIEEGENKQPGTEQLVMYVYKVDDIDRKEITLNISTTKVKNCIKRKYSY